MRQSITVVGMSDLHGYLPKDLPKGDVLCVCGDIVPLDVQRDMVESIAWLCTKFFPWVEASPYEKVIMVWGNHDFIGKFLYTDRNGQHRKPKRVLKKLMAPKKLTLLDDSECIYKGYKFYGSPWIPDLVDWAFYADHDQLELKFNRIPTTIDVLLTHCPPRVAEFGMVLQHGTYNTLADYGCDELRESVYKTKPQLHIFGHVHSGRHSRLEIDGTTYCNVSLKDEDYKVMYDPQIFKLT